MATGNQNIGRTVSHLEPKFRFGADSLPGVFLGDDLLPLLVLALGGAMAVGSILALVRPPASPRSGELARAPLGRSIIMIVVGAIAAIWALATLVS